MPRDPDHDFCVAIRPQLMAFVRHRYPGFSRAEVEDVVQKAFEHHFVYRRKHEIRNAAAHLHLMARWAAANRYRQIKQDGWVQAGTDGGDLIDRFAAPPPPPAVPPDELAIFLIHQWVEANRPEDLPLFILRVQAIPHLEIARRLGLDPDVERQRSCRLMGAIRRHLSELGIDDCLKALTAGGSAL